MKNVNTRIVVCLCMLLRRMQMYKCDQIVFTNITQFGFYFCGRSEQIVNWMCANCTLDKPADHTAFLWFSNQVLLIKNAVISASRARAIGLSTCKQVTEIFIRFSWESKHILKKAQSQGPFRVPNTNAASWTINSLWLWTFFCFRFWVKI